MSEIYSAELSSVGLITPISYDRESSFRQTMSSQLKTGIADLVNYDVEKKVLEKVAPYKKDLAGYFKNPAELDEFIVQSIQKGRIAHLKKLSDSNLIGFYGHLGRDLIAGFAKKILQKEGVTDSRRIDLWANKLLEPFENCITTSLNSQYDASHCIDALSASLVPSAGIGIVYELSKTNLSGTLPDNEKDQFNTDQVNLYKKCIQLTKMTAADVKSCALSTMRNGVNKVTEKSLSQIINEEASSTFKADIIKRNVWPSFQNCSQKVGENSNNPKSLTTQFTDCIDSLISATGSLLVADKINGTKAVSKALTPQEIKKLVADKSQQFIKCADDAKVKNKRVKGLLDITDCKNQITNEVTYKVVMETFNQTAKDTAKKNIDAEKNLIHSAKSALDRCWSSKQTSEARELCLKKAIIEFSQDATRVKLAEAIPDTHPDKSRITAESIQDISSCIDKNLPNNITESEDLTKRLDQCTGKLTKKVALKVASFLVRSTAKGNLPDGAIDLLIDQLVEKDFEKCIGDSPKDDQLESCSNSLIKSASISIADYSFEKEVNSYLNKYGGPEFFNTTQEKVQQFLEKLKQSTNKCIHMPGVKKEVMKHVNACMKSSISNIANYFGSLQLNKSLGNMYDQRFEDRARIEEEFDRQLSTCLAAKQGDEFTITDYTKNLYVCADKVGIATTKEVGRDQVDTALEKYLTDKPGLSLKKKREELRSEILGTFNQCLSKDPSQSAICIDNLKKEATQKVVLSYGRLEIKTQLNADSTPPQLIPVEDDFVKCSENTKAKGPEYSKVLDECTKKFALDFAKELGILKLNHLLKQTLGTEDFNKQKINIDAATIEYTACLNDLAKYSVNDALTSKLSLCTDKLTTSGMNIVRSSINKWMTTEEKDSAILRLKSDFSFLLPCLSALLPSSPYTPKLQENVDSSIKPLAVLISHYIDYNPNSADQTLKSLITTLSSDLKDVAKSDSARRNLVDYLYESGALDQFLKGVVRGTVKDAFGNLTEDEIPSDLRQILLKKEVYEDIFSSTEGQRLKEFAMEKILRPVLVDKIDLGSPALKISITSIKENVTKILINAPSFGEAILKNGLQKQINSMPGITKFFAKTLYGQDSLVWDKVRLSPDGIKAESYIKENVLLPKFSGKKLTKEENDKINKEAEDLVKKAVKNYR